MSGEGFQPAHTFDKPKSKCKALGITHTYKWLTSNSDLSFPPPVKQQQLPRLKMYSTHKLYCLKPGSSQHDVIFCLFWTWLWTSVPEIIDESCKRQYLSHPFCLCVFDHEALHFAKSKGSCNHHRPFLLQAIQYCRLLHIPHRIFSLMIRGILIPESCCHFGNRLNYTVRFCQIFCSSKLKNIESNQNPVMWKSDF